MFDIRYEYMRLVMKTVGFNSLAMTRREYDALYTLPGYTVRQHLNWKWPIIIREFDGRSVHCPPEMLMSYSGNIYKLYKDANDVAGLSEYFADRGKAKV